MLSLCELMASIEDGKNRHGFGVRGSAQIRDMVGTASVALSKADFFVFSPPLHVLKMHQQSLFENNSNPNQI